MIDLTPAKPARAVVTLLILRPVAALLVVPVLKVDARLKYQRVQKKVQLLLNTRHVVVAHVNVTVVEGKYDPNLLAKFLEPLCLLGMQDSTLM